MSNDNARDFLDSIGTYLGFGGGPQTGGINAGSMRLGTIDPYYTNGLAKVIFDGETSVNNKGFAWASWYTPVANDRVYLFPVGTSYLIGGSISSSLAYSRYNNLALASGYGIYSGSFHTPSFTKTVSGLVKLAGLVDNTTTGTLPTNSLIATLPPGFRPPVNMMFPAMTGSSNEVGLIRVNANGEIRTGSNIKGIWFSLNNIVFHTQSLSWTTPAMLNGFDLGVESGSSRPVQYAKDTLNRIILRGSFGNAGAVKTADTPVFNIDTTNRPSPQGVYTVGASVFDTTTGAFSHFFANSSTGDFSWRPGSANDDEVSVDGIVFPDKDATWIAPTMTSGWISYGASNTPGYYKDADGLVHLRGLIKSGTLTSAAFTLPTGYRPAKNVIRSTVSNAAAGRLDVTSAGTVVPMTGSNVWVSLDSVVFTAEA